MPRASRRPGLAVGRVVNAQDLPVPRHPLGQPLERTERRVGLAGIRVGAIRRRLWHHLRQTQRHQMRLRRMAARERRVTGRLDRRHQCRGETRGARPIEARLVVHDLKLPDAQRDHRQAVGPGVRIGRKAQHATKIADDVVALRQRLGHHAGAVIDQRDEFVDLLFQVGGIQDGAQLVLEAIPSRLLDEFADHRDRVPVWCPGLVGECILRGPGDRHVVPVRRDIRRRPLVASPPVLAHRLLLVHGRRHADRTHVRCRTCRRRAAGAVVDRPHVVHGTHIRGPDHARHDIPFLNMSIACAASKAGRLWPAVRRALP